MNEQMVGFRRDDSISQVNWFLSSTFLHLAAFAALWVLGSIFNDIVLPPTVEFTVIGGAAALEMPVAVAPNPVPSPKAVPVVKATKVPVLSQEKSTFREKAAAPVVAKVAPKELVAEDLETQDVESLMSRPVAMPTQKLADADLEQGFSKVDSETSEKLNETKKHLETAANEFSDEQEKQLADLDRQRNLDNQALHKASAQLRAENQAKITAAQQAERQQQAAATAAREAAAARARQAAAEAAAAESAQEDARIATEARQHAQGLGNGAEISGVEGPIRDIADLKAMPGNQRPFYDNADRLAGRQGQVSFLAYVTKEGRISELKMVQSSGHRNLDGKTLVAIKSWRFYPGQEGWVEIPFRWDLKGGPQEMPATLRRKISQQ